MYSSPNMTIITYKLLCLFNCVPQIKIKVLFSTSSDILFFINMYSANTCCSPTRHHKEKLKQTFWPTQYKVE